MICRRQRINDRFSVRVDMTFESLEEGKEQVHGKIALQILNGFVWHRNCDY